MTLTRRAIIAFFIAFLPLVTIAQESPADSKTEIIDQIIKGIGIEKQLRQPPRALQSQFQNNALGLEPSQDKLMMEQFKQAYTIDSLVSDARDLFRQQYNPVYADSIINWLDTKTTRIVREAEKELHTLQGTRKRVVRMYELEQNPAGQERMKLMQSLNEFTSTAESTVQSYAAIFRSVVSAFSVLSDKRTFSETQIDGIVNNYRSDIQSQIEQETINQFLIMYYDLENETLSEYISFYRTEPGSWLNQTRMKSKRSAYEAAGKRFVSSVKSMKTEN